MSAPFNITIENTGECYPCSSVQSLLLGMEALGRNGIPVGCRGGGCGVCKIHISQGTYTAQKMSRAYVSAEEEQRGIVLACRTRPSSDIRLNVVGKMIKSVVRGANDGGIIKAWLEAAKTTQ
jgi:ferredoxin